MFVVVTHGACIILVFFLNTKEDFEFEHELEPLIWSVRNKEDDEDLVVIIVVKVLKYNVV